MLAVPIFFYGRADNDRQKSCNNADCYISVIDNQPLALLRIPTECSQPSENDSLSNKVSRK